MANSLISGTEPAPAPAPAGKVQAFADGRFMAAMLDEFRMIVREEIDNG